MTTDKRAALNSGASNVSICVIGAKDVILGQNKTESGKAALSVGMAQAFNAPFFAQEEGKKVLFTLAKTNGTFSKAQLETLATELCQLPTTTSDADKLIVTNALKNASVYGAAAYIAANPDLGIGLNKSNKLINVPVNVAIEMKDEDGKATAHGKALLEYATALLQDGGIEKPTAKQIGERLNRVLVVCDGKRHPTRGLMPTTPQAMKLMAGAALKQGIVEKKTAKKGGRTTKKTNETFTKSLRLVQDVMSSQFVDGKTDFALTIALRKKLSVMKATLDNYFKQHPLSEDDTTE